MTPVPPTAFLAAQFARPLTHRVTTTFASGNARTHDVRSEGAAENYATGERRKIGRDLIDRPTGETVRVVSVTIAVLAPSPEMTAAQLNDWYEEVVGYRPQVDDPTMTDDDLRSLCAEYAVEAARHGA